eukprot:TRINITY_DN13066_c0_g1_i2.p2 TRINITY_DN13066_c0_g1~~TRINITY_DN13066_c0_g1_i2.p2  ORF type:complete len:108 (+),score=16.88 TRINITY_DN13066_c0_g1_i2:403-726(+)
MTYQLKIDQLTLESKRVSRALWLLFPSHDDVINPVTQDHLSVTSSPSSPSHASTLLSPLVLLDQIRRDREALSTERSAHLLSLQMLKEEKAKLVALLLEHRIEISTT